MWLRTEREKRANVMKERVKMIYGVFSCLQVLAESNYPPSSLKMVPSLQDSNLEERNDRQIKVIWGEREFVENEQRQTDCCL